MLYCKVQLPVMEAAARIPKRITAKSFPQFPAGGIDIIMPDKCVHILYWSTKHTWAAEDQAPKTFKSTPFVGFYSSWPAVNLRVGSICVITFVELFLSAMCSNSHIHIVSVALWTTLQGVYYYF